jgi:DNA polymerase I-like protein with 3'-5' exonuclease and polymerase domains
MQFMTVAPPPIYVSTPELVERAIRHCTASRLLGVDTETLGKRKDPETKKTYSNMTDQVVVMGLSPDEGSRYLVPTRYLHCFREVLEHPNPKAFHTFRFDWHRIRNTLGTVVKGRIADAWVLDFLYDEDTRENRHSLKDMGYDYFGIPMSEYKELFGKEDPRQISQPGHPLFQKYLDYSSLDPWVTRKAAEKLLKEIGSVPVDEESGWTLEDHYWDIEEPQVQCLCDMERLGVRIDTEHLGSVRRSVDLEMEQLAAEINRAAGYPLNPASTQQVQKLLFEDLGLRPIKKTPGGAASVDEDVLSHYAYKGGVEVCELLLRYRSCVKLRGTYVDGLLDRLHTDGRIHTTYNPVKVTGRLSSTDPNLQNIPKPGTDPHGIRAAFVADNDDCVLIVPDYSQLEMRILAHFSGDPNMVRAIHEGMDLHSFAAAMAMGIPYEDFNALRTADEKRIEAKEIPFSEYVNMRSGMKAVGFGIVYGAQAPKISATLSENLKRSVDKAEAQGFIDRYLQVFPGIGQYMAEQIGMARQLGHVRTLSGRFRRLSQIRSDNFMDRSHAERQAINAPIQGSAADITKKTMIACWQDGYLHSLGCTVRMQVHDELVFNCPKETAAEAAEIIRAYGENPFRNPLLVPLDFKPKIVRDWKSAK